MLFIWYGCVLGQLSKHLVSLVDRERESRFGKHVSISFYNVHKQLPNTIGLRQRFTSWMPLFIVLQLQLFCYLSLFQKQGWSMLPPGAYCSGRGREKTKLSPMYHTPPFADILLTKWVNIAIANAMRKTGCPNSSVLVTPFHSHNTLTSSPR